VQGKQPIPCPRSLRAQWPNPLAGEWLASYPQLFDEDDYRCTRRQPEHHFWEWLAAIRILERDGAYSLVEKYVYKNHPRKLACLTSILSAREQSALHEITRGVQPPDLFVYMPDKSRFWFAEVKGPSDRVRPRQAASHLAIERALRVPVEVLGFVLVDG
jgi:VRR-NUC domain